MTNGHGHAHGHAHHHGETGTADLPAALDTSVPDEELSPDEFSRRSVFRRAGLLGAGLAAGGVLAGTAGEATAAPATSSRLGGYLWLAGDHHIHTQYSFDGKYRVIDQVRQGSRHGLGWLVITDHGSTTHARIGVEKVNPDIRAARAEFDEDTLVFQGLEWNIPAAEHGTVFVHPGANEVAVLKEFETDYDGSVKGAISSTTANEALAIAGLDFLAEARRRRRVQDILMLANHPARRGVDSPHEIRNWRDAQSEIAVGMEAAPGHQAAGIPASANGPGRARGQYDGSPGADSFSGYPAESYRTWGGFDWMTATVGGLWDSLLAEGKPWWVTANSDSHNVYTDTATRPAGSDYNTNGTTGDPVYADTVDLTQGDYWPGQYTRTHVGAETFSYAAVMAGIRAGRVWVDHGGLVKALNVRLSGGGGQITLGGVLHVPRGTEVTLTAEIALADQPNWAQFVPELARVDVIQGDVTGAVSDAGRDTFTAPTAKVVRSFDTSGLTGTVRLTHRLGAVESPVYVRLRGTDGNRSATGLMGAAADPNGPAMDVIGDADPWRDLWFYANPLWVLPS